MLPWRETRKRQGPWSKGRSNGRGGNTGCKQEEVRVDGEPKFSDLSLTHLPTHGRLRIEKSMQSKPSMV